MANQNLNCFKCKQILNYLSCHSYAEPPAMKSKEGKFYCFDCFKSVSSCRVCDKSVAQMEINIHDKKTWYQPWEKIYFREAKHIKPFDMCGSYCDFFCSPECLSQDENRNHELREKRNQEKLAKGWKHCEECVEMFEGWFAEIGINKEIRKKVLLSRGKVLPPGKKICSFHQINKEKDHYIKEVIYPKAQKWWDNLTYEQKLAEVKRLDINWIIRKDEKEGRKATHQEVASEQEVPPFFISQKFEHQEPCRSCGKVWKCAGDINCGNNDPNKKPSYCISCPPSDSEKSNSESGNENNQSGLVTSEIEKKQLQLQEIKKQGGNPEKIQKLEKEIQELALKLEKENKTNKTPTFPYLYVFVIFVSLIVVAILLTKINSKKKSKTKL